MEYTDNSDTALNKTERYSIIPTPAKRLQRGDAVVLNGKCVLISNAIECTDGGFVLRTTEGSVFNLSPDMADLVMLKVKYE